MPKKRDPDACPICNSEIEVKGRVGKWYDDKSYEEICYICACTVKQIKEVNNEWIVCDNEKKVHIRTVEEMAELGWSSKEQRKRTEISIKAVKAALKKAKKGIA